MLLAGTSCKVIKIQTISRADFSVIEGKHRLLCMKATGRYAFLGGEKEIWGFGREGTASRA